MEPTVTRRRLLRYLGMGSAALLLAACGQPAPSPTPKPTPKPEAAKAVETPRASPAAKAAEALTLTYWVGLNSNVAATMKSFNEMACYKELEKTTGVHVEFQHPPVGQETEQFNLMVASRKFPDVVEYGWLSVPGGPAKAIKDGVILRLNDVADQHAPNLRRVLGEHPVWRKQVVTDEGDLYVFPFLRGDPYLLTFTGPVLRKDWLDRLGLAVPTTLDQWHTVLKAFKEKDPNGNSKPDELPFTPARDRATSAFDSHAFVGAWGLTRAFYQDQGTVRFGPLQPEFQDFLKTMATWYKEGLVDPDFVTTDLKLFDAKVTGNQLGSFVILTGSGIGKYVGLMATKDATFKLVPAPYPVLQAGDKPQLGQRDNVFPGTGAAITTTNKHVEQTARWLDFAYSPEGHMLFNFGIEGVSYKMVDGYPSYTDEIVKNPQGLTLSQAMARNFRSNFNGPFVQDRRYFEQYAALPEQKQSIEVWMQPTNEKLMPPVTPTREESSRFASVMNDVNTLYEEMLNKVITTAEPPASWDRFTQQARQMGIEEAIKIQQAALERYNKR